VIPSFHFHCYIRVLITVIIIHHFSHHLPHQERFVSFHFHCYIRVLITVIIIHHFSHHSPHQESFAMNSESTFHVRVLFPHIKTFRLQTYCNLNGGWCHDWVLMECFLMTAVWETLSSFGHAVQSAAKAIIIMSLLLLLLLFRRRYTESPASLQDECGRLLQFLLLT